MNQYPNPYTNPYMMQMQGMQQSFQPAPQRQVDKVNGRNGAMQYPMGPNSQAWILDENGLISWLVITDSAGYKTVTPYDISPHQDAPVPDFGSLESRIARLEEQMNGNSNTANFTAARRKANDKSNDCAD